jgi:hypothetical protein
MNWWCSKGVEGSKPDFGKAGLYSIVMLAIVTFYFTIG